MWTADLSLLGVRTMVSEPDIWSRSHLRLSGLCWGFEMHLGWVPVNAPLIKPLVLAVAKGTLARCASRAKGLMALALMSPE